MLAMCSGLSPCLLRPLTSALSDSRRLTMSGCRVSTATVRGVIPWRQLGSWAFMSAPPSASADRTAACPSSACFATAAVVRSRRRLVSPKPRCTPQHQQALKRALPPGGSWSGRESSWSFPGHRRLPRTFICGAAPRNMIPMRYPAMSHISITPPAVSLHRIPTSAFVRRSSGLYTQWKRFIVNSICGDEPDSTTSAPSMFPEKVFPWYTPLAPPVTKSPWLRPPVKVHPETVGLALDSTKSPGHVFSLMTRFWRTPDASFSITIPDPVPSLIVHPTSCGAHPCPVSSTPASLWPCTSLSIISPLQCGPNWTPAARWEPETTVPAIQGSAPASSMWIPPASPCTWQSRMRQSDFFTAMAGCVAPPFARTVIPSMVTNCAPTTMTELLPDWPSITTHSGPPFPTPLMTSPRCLVPMTSEPTGYLPADSSIVSYGLQLARSFSRSLPPGLAWCTAGG
mmetsp:Transcript_105633/g.182162  ORF Transcript_105633/g.182162 Transcript_105633/m.182162 type:complete len:455 (-) Transcript_105633:2315-3679(-)